MATKLDLTQLNITPESYGAVGDGATDDTAALVAAASAAENNVLVLTGTYNITSEIVLNNVLLIGGKGNFTGTGSVRGVLKNDSVPHSVFKVPYNISLAKNRSDEEAADLYLDPCLGDDANDGTSGTPVKTLSGLKTRLNTLIGLGADTAITVIVRDGLVEVSSDVDLDTAQATATVTIKGNGKERPIFTGPLVWLFRDGETAANTNSDDIYALFDIENAFERVPISTSVTSAVSSDYDKTWPRNTAQAITVAATTATLTPDVDVLAKLNSATNLSKARLRVIQSWSSSLYHDMTINGSDLDYTIPAGQSSFYYDGFNAGVNDGYAPYLIEGLDSYKTDETWCNLGATVQLPRSKSNNFIAPKALDNPITISAARYHFEHVRFSFHMATKSAMLGDYFGTAQQSNAFILVTGDDCSIKKSVIKDVEGTGIFANGDNFVSQFNTFYRIGHTACFCGADGAATTVTGFDFLSNEVQYWGYNYSGGKAVSSPSTSFEIKDNRIFNGCSQAVDTVSNAAGSVTGQIFRNVVYNCGMPNGVRSDRWSVNDTGALYHNGLGATAVACNITYNANVVFNVDGYRTCHGVYIDNGCEGITFNNNLIYNVKNYTIDLRDVSSTTQNNTYDHNILFGNYRCADVAGGTFTDNAVVGSGALGQNVEGGGLSVTKPFSGEPVQGSIKNDVAHIRYVENFLNAGYIIDTAPLSQYVTDMLDTRDWKTGTFTPLVEGTTTAGAGTYSLQTGYYKVDQNVVEFVLRVTWTAHTGTGNIKISLNDLPLTSLASTGMVYPVTLWSNVSADKGYVGQNSKTVELDPAVALGSSGSVAITGRYPYVQ